MDWTDDRIEALAGRIRIACRTALQRLVGVLHDEIDPQVRSRFVALLLAYARRHLSLMARGDGPAQAVSSSDLADRVLSLPLFPSRFGGTTTGWRLVRRFCTLYGESPAEAATLLLRELPDRLPPELREWLASTLVEGNVMRQRSTRSTSAPLHRFEGEAVVDQLSLGATLQHWLTRLCGDRLPLPLEVSVRPYDQKELADCYSHGPVLVAETHWLVQWARTEGARDPKVLAWLLLAVYAEINAALDEVTDEHEIAFQAELARVLANGELYMLRAP